MTGNSCPWCSGVLRIESDQHIGEKFTMLSCLNPDCKALKEMGKQHVEFERFEKPYSPSADRDLVAIVAMHAMIMKEPGNVSAEAVVVDAKEIADKFIKSVEQEGSHE